MRAEDQIRDVRVDRLALDRRRLRGSHALDLLGRRPVAGLRRLDLVVDDHHRDAVDERVLVPLLADERLAARLDARTVARTGELLPKLHGGLRHRVPAAFSQTAGTPERRYPASASTVAHVTST